MQNKIYLNEGYFEKAEKLLIESGEFSASTFIYSTGVKAVKIKNSKGEFISLPYMGQMIWRAQFLGRELVMQTMFDEPIPAKINFHETYGCFLMHCGLTAMGNPTDIDTHLPHGELPIAKYQENYIITGEDEKGKYIAIGGKYTHKICYTYNYEFSPLIKLYEGATSIDIEVEFTNKKDVPLEYYYLCHINHKPVNGSKLVYTADRSKIVAHHEVPADYNKEIGDKTNAYLDMLDKDASIMDEVGGIDQSYAPEIVFTCSYEADEDGNAYTMQVMPDEYATYVIHKPSELPFGIRWISRTEDEDTMGMVLPATAEHKGLAYCRQKGFQSYLKKGETVSYHMQTGLLTPKDSKIMQEKIKKMGF